MDDGRHAVLIGLRGSGKSTIGRVLAERLGRPFVDLDDRTPGYAGEATVADVFANQGEEAFRSAEICALTDVLDEPDSVISLGGGTPTAPGAEELLRDTNALLIYLRAQPETLRARLTDADNTDRPALLGDDALSEIEQVFAARDPLYRELATEVIETDAMTEEQLLNALTMCH